MTTASRLSCIDRFAYDLIRKRRETIAAASKTVVANDDESRSEYRDLLSLYIEKGASIPLTCHSDDTHLSDGETATDSELRDTILNFLIAGRDTTANVTHCPYRPPSLPPSPTLPR
jgi:cytochrome P450